MTDKQPETGELRTAFEDRFTDRATELRTEREEIPLDTTGRAMVGELVLETLSDFPEFAWSRCELACLDRRGQFRIDIEGTHTETDDTVVFTIRMEV